MNESVISINAKKTNGGGPSIHPSILRARVDATAALGRRQTAVSPLFRIVPSSGRKGVFDASLRRRRGIIKHSEEGRTGPLAASFPILIRFCLASDGDGGDDLLTGGRAETREREGRKEGSIERTSHRSRKIGKEEGHRRARRRRRRTRLSRGGN